MKPAILLLSIVALASVASSEGAVEIEGADTHYTLPLTPIASGDSVVWTSADNGHATRDGTSFGDADACFFAVHSPDEASTPVRFDLAAGVLSATQDDLTTQCLNAQIAPTGNAATVPFYCILHPTMRGTLVVTAS